MIRFTGNIQEMKNSKILTFEVFFNSINLVGSSSGSSKYTKYIYNVDGADCEILILAFYQWTESSSDSSKLKNLLPSKGYGADIEYICVYIQNTHTCECECECAH